MRKFTVILLMTVLTTTYAVAQDASSASGKSAKVVYGEIGGPGLLSVNYDMRFSKTNDGFGFRAGFGGWAFKNSKALYVPLGLNYITSRNNKDYFEAGGGVSIVSSNIFEEKGVFKSTFGFLSLGYRKQPADGGYFFKAALVPVFGNGTFFPYYAGVGFGFVL